MFILCSISSGLKFGSVNQTSIFENSDLKTLKYLILKQKIYYEKMYTKLLNLADNHCWQYYSELQLPP